MSADSIRDLLNAEPFRPFRVTMSSRKSYVVANPGLAVPLKFELFIALENGENFALCGYRNMASIETTGNGVPGRTARRQRRRR